MYNKLEKRSQSSKKGVISSHEIVKSSQTPILLLPDQTCNRVNQTIYRIADLDESRNTISNYFINEENDNCFSIPLEEIVCEHTDRKIIVYAGNRKLKENERRNGKVHAYEFGWAYNLHSEANKQINKTVYSFLANSFPDDKDQIKSLLEKSSSVVVMILNQESTLSNKITLASIVSLVMFGTDNLIGTCIDYVATVVPYTGMNFGPFLIHYAQVFGSKAIERRSNGSIKNNFSAMLFCKDKLSFYYERLGFSSNKIREYIHKDEYKRILDRMQLMDLLGKEESSDKYNIMTINRRCYRFINYLSYVPRNVESSLYVINDDDETIQRSNDTLSEKLASSINNKIKFIIQERRHYEHTYLVEDIYVKANYNESVFFDKIYRLGMCMPIGKIYSSSIIELRRLSANTRTIDNISSDLIQEALNPFHVTLFFPKLPSRNYNTMPCWANVACSHCTKSVYVKKSTGEDFNVFMNKLTVSVWFVHIFGLSNIQNNDWYDINSTWNVCPTRTGCMYNKLKMALHKDSLKIESTNNECMMRCFQNLESLWESIAINFQELYENVARITFFTNKHIKERETSKSYGKSYQERSQELLESIAPRKRKTAEEERKDQRRLKQNQNRQKRKQEDKLKHNRHNAEKEWRNHFYGDLDLQLRFRDIEYVDVATCATLKPVSTEHVNELKEEQAIANEKRRTRRKNQNQNDINFNHFLMFESKN